MFYCSAARALNKLGLDRKVSLFSSCSSVSFFPGGAIVVTVDLSWC